MAMDRIVEGVYAVPMGKANAFLIESDEGLTLIDAGYPGKEALAFEAIRRLGRSLSDLNHLIFTHAHPDHIGSGAAIVRVTQAKTYMHHRDIPLAESGGPFRPLTPAPGLLRHLLCNLLYDPKERTEPIMVDRSLVGGEILPIAGGIEVIPTPGHCEGQVALLMRSRQMLFVGDVCMNILGLGDPVGFEDLETGRESQCNLADLPFEAAGFGHGAPIAREARKYFRSRFSAYSHRAK